MIDTTTFLRLRPGTQVNEITAGTRRREGTTAIELDAGAPAEVSACIAGGVLPIATSADVAGVAAWVLLPGDARAMADNAIDGRRITMIHSNDRADTLDGLSRSRCAYLRTGRSRVREAVELCDLPGIDARVSVYVDTVDDAVAAVAAGAGDLLLRDWGAEQIGELRDALDTGLIERVAIPPEVDVDEARVWFPAKLFKAYLDQIDAAGRARPRYGMGTRR